MTLIFSELIQLLNFIMDGGCMSVLNIVLIVRGYPGDCSLKPLVSFCFPSPPPSRGRGKEGEVARAMAGLDIMPLQGQKSEEGKKEGRKEGRKEGENVVVATVTPLGRVSQRYLRTTEGARAGITQPRSSYSPRLWCVCGRRKRN